MACMSTITLHFMHLPTTTIVLPLNGANSNLLSSKTPIFDQHLERCVQDACRMLESCRFTSLNCPIQSKTIVVVGMCFSTTTIVLPLNGENSNLSNNRTQAFRPTFVFFL
ncbi:hypothetical protein MTR_8g068720 [Medicago truncatula]|uniref:Uncharacterized protein n=1 Tax=Medicago truncatula TaxID=3880 RepID=A0A072TRI3_MEDTR|nr:hypothetical protein MTR_8g068720 [Medicago truncatula]